MKFSIVIPCYNVAPYIAEALDSVLAQTYVDWECICVDDGSQDETAGILDDYAACDARFRVIHQINGGVAAARNAGLDVAGGAWLVFLDGDDIWHPQLLELCAKGFQCHPECQAVRFANSLTDDPRQFVQSVGRIEHVDMKVLPCSTWTRENSFPSFCSYAYVRDLVCDIRFMNLKRGEDSAWATDCLTRVGGIVKLQDIVLYAYRNRIGSAMTSDYTAEKLHDDVIWQLYRARCIATSGRPIEKELRWGLTKAVALCLSRSFFSISFAERASAWQTWLDGMNELLSTGLLVGWCGWFARICVFTRSQTMFFLLFRVPLWIKQWRIY